MNTSIIRPPLSNLRAELLKTFSADIPEEHLIELKNIMARFLLESARAKADTAWDQKGYTDEKLRELLNQ